MQAHTPLSSETLHASTVAIGGHGVLIEGRSGAGKSDLALRLIDRGATLVSDDYTVVARTPAGLVASAPATIAGRIEVRGIGLVDMPHVGNVPVALLVRLATPDRMPDPEVRQLAGVDVPMILIDGFEGSAPFKVELALARTLR